MGPRSPRKGLVSASRLTLQNSSTSSKHNLGRSAIFSEYQRHMVALQSLNESLRDLSEGLPSLFRVSEQTTKLASILGSLRPTNQSVALEVTPVEVEAPSIIQEVNKKEV